MKPANMYKGLKVVVKKCAEGYAASKVGVVGVLDYAYHVDGELCWRIETPTDYFGVFPHEVRKARDGE